MVGSQVPKLEGPVITVVPIYAAFLLIMAFLGARRLSYRSTRPRTRPGTDLHRRHAQLACGPTPLAPALPAGCAITPAIVVTQTLIELIGMLVCIRLIPRLVPASPTPTTVIDNWDG
ncbi:MAG: Bile acid:sodium symporter [Propionibacteriaceae bacterium]|nr:Bile acid:sodium symporter [Propionibacteriaceae bacterium]